MLRGRGNKHKIMEREKVTEQDRDLKYCNRYRD